MNMSDSGFWLLEEVAAVGQICLIMNMGVKGRGMARTDDDDGTRTAPITTTVYLSRRVTGSCLNADLQQYLQDPLNTQRTILRLLLYAPHII